MDRRRKEGLVAREIENLESDLVLDALVFCEGNESAASRMLNVNRNTVRRVRKSLPETLPDKKFYNYKTSPEGAPWQ